MRIVPVGLTYWEKNRFKSRVRVELGPALEAARFAPAEGEDPFEAARRLTQAIADALKALTLQLSAWDDLPLLQTAETLYALKTGQAPEDGARLNAFSKGMALLREEQPQRFEALKQQLHEYQRRLELVRARPDRLPVEYRPSTVALFVVRSLLWMLALPLFLLGMALFVVPYWVPIALVALTRPKEDVEATVKILTLLVLAPFWWALLAALAWVMWGPAWGVAALALVLPLALFTRFFLERRLAAWRDARTFLVLLSRAHLHRQLVAQGERLAEEIEAVAAELRPKVLPEAPAGAA